MTLLGLLTTLVLPSMQRWHDAVQTRSRVATVVETLQAAVFAAPAGRQRLVMRGASFAAPAAANAALPASAASSPMPGNGASAAAAAAGGDGSGAYPVDASLLRIELPTGWRAERVVDAEFLPNGLCRPGFATLRTERGSPIVVVVEGPVCTVRTSDREPAT